MKRKTSRIISVVLIVLMVLSTTVTGFADELPESSEEQKTAEDVIKKEPEKEEKKAEPEQHEPEEKPQEKTPAEQEAPSQETSEQKSEKKKAPKEKQEKEETDSPKKSLKAALTDGRYEAEAFKFDGGTGKAYMTCEYVIIKDGKAYAVFKASADTMTHIYMGEAPSTDETPSLYDPDTKTCGEDVYPINSLMVAVPVVLNSDDTCAVRTTAMSKPHWVNYTYNITLSESAKKISDDSTIPEFEPSEDETDPDDGKDDEKEPDKEDTKTLKDGTYKVNATTDRKMFYLYPKEKNPAKVIIVKKNGKITATITLTGEGYDYVYMGTPAQAKKAGKKNWIKYKKVNGYYTFNIPVAKLDKKLAITPHSSKYESDGDPKTEPWRPDKWIIFYSKGAKKVKDGSSIATKKKTAADKRKSSGKDTTVSSNANTSAVNNSTGLKDGTYKADRFSWSGGSGRLAYIRCNKIVVKGGKAYATIEFGSSKYDSLKANGRVYSKSGGGNSKFTIPVKLNANNTIIGRTTAMSMPHWVRYTIFIYKKGAGTGKDGKDTGSGKTTSTKKLSSEAPDLMGLEFKEEVKVEHAEYFKIYKYEQGITLIEVDQAGDTALYKEDKKDKADKEESGEAAEENQDHIEYDEEGNIIARSQNEITDELYQNNIVNYLVIPEDVEIPAGLDKDCIIIQQPVTASYIASPDVLDDLVELGVCDAVKTVGMDEKDIGQDEIISSIKDEKIKALGSYEDLDYAALIKSKTDIALFPDAVLPEIVKDPEKDEEAQAESDKRKEELDVFQRRFSALGVPMIVDRSGDEKSNYAAAEWIKVYGAIYGQEEKADAAFDKYTKENKEKKVTDD